MIDINKVRATASINKQNLEKKRRNATNSIDKKRLDNVIGIENSKDRSYNNIISTATKMTISKMSPFLAEVLGNNPLASVEGGSDALLNVIQDIEKEVPGITEALLNAPISGSLTNKEGKLETRGIFASTAERLSIPEETLKRFFKIEEESSLLEPTLSFKRLVPDKEKINKFVTDKISRKLGVNIDIGDEDFVSILQEFGNLQNESLNEIQQGQTIQGARAVVYNTLDPKQKKDKNLIQEELIRNLRQNPRQYLTNRTVFELGGEDISDLINRLEDTDEFDKLKIEITARTPVDISQLDHVLPGIGPGHEFTITDEDGNVVGTYFDGLTRAGSKERYSTNPTLRIPDRLLTEIHPDIENTVYLADYIDGVDDIIKVIPDLSVKAETGQSTYTLLLNGKPITTEGQTITLANRGDVVRLITQIITNQKIQ